MDAKAHDLNFVLGQRQQWVVPVYQRHYEWESTPDKQIPKLWEDLRDKAIERLDNRSPFPHYFGAIIYSEPNQQAFGAIQRRFLVDGQQRITSFQLVLAALREVAREHDNQNLVTVANTYLFNEKSDGMKEPERERFKLWPSSFDRQMFQLIIENNPDEIRHEYTPQYFYKNGKLIAGRSPNLLRAYWLLLEGISSFIEERAELNESAEEILDALIAGFLSGFQIVVIQLDQNDDAQEIFASLNGLSKPLSPFDLIRNDVFHRARKSGEDDEELFDSRWKEFEKPFWAVQVRQGRLKRARADHLISHAVIAETAREVNVSKIATEYQHYARDRAFSSVSEELDVLLSHARNYRKLEETDCSTPIGSIANTMRLADISTFHPLILWIAAYSHSDIHDRYFSLLEGYIVRREICGLTTKNYNKVASSFIRAMRGKNDSLEAFKKHMHSQTGEISRIPTDADVAEAFANRSVYGPIRSPQLRYILQQLEYALRNKFDEVTIPTSDLTVEHVMPQKWSKNWPLQNGNEVEYESSFSARLRGVELDNETALMIDQRSKVINTFGNLTLVTGAMNPSLGNVSWKNKKGRLSQSLLALNRFIAEQEQWDEETISKRGADLARVAISRWPAE